MVRQGIRVLRGAWGHLTQKLAMTGQRLPALRAYGEVRGHIARGELRAATPTAFHPRPRRASTLNLRLPPSAVHVCWWSED
jgi:hypothetical protein